MRILNVAEKPSMARQISSLLSRDEVDSTNGNNKYCRNFMFPYKYNGVDANMIMTSVLGHVTTMDFAEGYSDWQRVPIEELLVAPINSVISSNMKDVAENLKIEARKSQILIIWTDCDREGEYIGSEIVQICLQSNSRLDVYRARYSVLNRVELDRSMRQLSRLDMKQVAAAELRSELDLRGGAAFTRLQTLKFRNILNDLAGKIISYGSCQFPTLGFVVEQYLKVRNFTPDPFWLLHLEVRKTKFTWKRNRLFDRLVCLVLYERCLERRTVAIKKVESKGTSKWRPVPLRTVEMQKMCSRVLKMSSEKVMELAEKLYNQGYISYPRTETDMFENDFDVRSLVSKQTSNPTWGTYAGKLMDGAFRAPRKGKNNDKAHPPIHPTKDGSALNGAEAKLYEFITRRFLACCSEDAKGFETVVIAGIREEEFKARGIMVQEYNYLEIYIYENWNDQAIGNFVQGEELIPDKLEMNSGMTTSPKLLSESELIGTMDKNGIGTDATIHEHIKKIIERNYTVKNRESRFHPTNLGLALVVGYDHVGLEHSLTKPRLRCMLEADLKAICEGRSTKQEVLHKTIESFQEALSSIMSKLDILYRALQDNSHGGILQPAPLDPSNHDSEPRQRRVPNPRANGRNPPPSSDDDEDDNNNHGNRSARINNTTNVNSEIIPGPNCPCGKPSSRKITRKEGPNLNRAFWSCEDCKYFCWVGEEDNQGSKKIVKPTKTTDVICNCGVSATVRTVSKDGPNKGRPFAVCGSQNKESKCQFFSWQDEINAPIEKGTSKFGHSTQCQCGMVAVREVTRTGANQGRSYLRCSKTVKRCGFFEWEDGQASMAPPKSNTSLTCYKCGQGGHFSNNCTESNHDSSIPPRGRGRGRGRSTRGSSKRSRKTSDDYDEY